MNIRFLCPECDAPARVDFPGSGVWQCSACDHRLHLAEPQTEKSLSACAVCGNHELYKKKDFPHGLGMALLVLACLASAIAYGLYLPWLTWGILMGTALFDALLYLVVGDVVACYRCNAHFRGYASNPEHKPHELTVAERYRQERLRREGV